MLCPYIATPLSPTVILPSFVILPLLAYIATEPWPVKLILAFLVFCKSTQPSVLVSSWAIATKFAWVPVIFLLLITVELAKAILLNAAAVPVLVLSKLESTSTVILLLSNKKAL